MTRRALTLDEPVHAEAALFLLATPRAVMAPAGDSH